jgi:hypothetical protein
MFFNLNIISDNWQPVHLSNKIGGFIVPGFCTKKQSTSYESDEGNRSIFIYSLWSDCVTLAAEIFTP